MLHGTRAKAIIAAIKRRHGKDARFLRLFQIGLPEEMYSNTALGVSPQSLAFGLEDAKELAELAAEAQLDIVEDALAYAAPLHALIALLDIGKDAAPFAAEIVAKRVLACQPYSESDDEYVVTHLYRALEAVLVEFGPAAVPAIISQIERLSTEKELIWDERNDSLLSLLIDAVLQIVFEAGDLELATQVGFKLMSCLESIYAEKTSPENSHRSMTDRYEGIDRLVYVI